MQFDILQSPKRKSYKGEPSEHEKKFRVSLKWALNKHPFFWDGASRGSRFVIETCEQCGKSHLVIMMSANQ